MNKYVVALYIRLSLEDEAYDSMSIDNQRLALHQYAQTLAESDIEIQEFVDNGYTGTNFERPAVQELLDLVQSNRIDCIIVKDFSRFGRDSLEVGYLMERVFPIFRTRFISIQDNFDSGELKGDTGGIDVAFKYLLNEYYSRDLSEKSKSAKYAKMKRGEYQAKVCFYGYKVTEDKKLVPDENTAPVIKMIYELAHEGKSSYDIVKALYAKKIPTPSEYRKATTGSTWHESLITKGVWQQSMVIRILADERYTGMYIIGKHARTEIGGRNSRLKDESEWFKIPNHHPAIIDKAFYDEVQSILNVKRFKIQKKSSEYPLKGKILCGCCNHVMQRLNDFYFKCQHSRIDESYNCHGLIIYENELESSIFGIIKKQAEIFLNLDKLSVCSVLLESQAAKLSEHDKRIQEINDNKRILYEQFINGDLDDEGYKIKKAQLDAELSNIKRLHSTISAEIRQSRAVKDENGEITQIAEEVKITDSLTRSLVEALIDKVYVHSPEHIEIVWRFEGFVEN
jgi:DNA invertase Pin-like site-specific DNA recombinase